MSDILCYFSNPFDFYDNYHKNLIVISLPLRFHAINLFKQFSQLSTLFVCFKVYFRQKSKVISNL